MKSHFKAFLHNPLIKDILEQDETPEPPQGPPSNTLDLKKIQNTLSQLTKAVETLKSAPPPKPQQKANAQNSCTPGPTSKPATRTYSAIAGARPPNPSLVVDLAPFGINQKDRVKPVHLCSAINQGLRNISPPQVELAAIRWTAKGNLVVTGGPTSTPHTLQLAAPHISNIISSTLSLPSNRTLAQPRANVKWSKILINGVPTRASSGAGPNTGPASPDLCHSALAAINPSYASLTITQKPSWVRPPSSYTPSSISSLSVAFEDPDGSKLKQILAERYLYIFGHRALVKKWKYRQPKTKDNSKSTAVKHTQDGDTPDEEDIDITSTPATISAPPSILSKQPTRKSIRKPKPARPSQT